VPVVETVPTRTLPKAPETKIAFEGVGNLLHRLAQCCSPLPGDDVIGFITRGRGITIHRRDCRNLLNVDLERGRFIGVDWRKSEQAVYPVLVQIEAFDRAGLLHDISGVVAADGVNLSSANVATNHEEHTAIITATLEIANADQLTRILSKIDRLQNVIEARRVTSA
jgi:GTP pyrophosphokinase